MQNYKNIKSVFQLALIGGLISITNSCSYFKTKTTNPVRYVASDESDLNFLSKGLYPNSLITKNIFDSEGRAKVVFNLPPYISPGGVGILSEMLKTINEAHSSIRMSVFQFNHVQVFDALKNAIKRGVKVFVATDLCYSGKAGYKEYFDDLRLFMNANGQDGATQIVDDKTPSCDTMFNHNKYMIVDIETPATTKAWFGSFNPTNHGSVENVELAIVVKDSKVAEVLKLDFDQQIQGLFKVYKKGIYSVGDKVAALTEAEVKSNLIKGIKVSYPKVKVGDTDFEFILSPKVKSLTRIVEEVYNAKKEIVFSSFAIADQMLISSLINKANTTKTDYNLFSVLALPHPNDLEGLVYIKNGDAKNQTPVAKNPIILKPIVDEIKSTQATPSNFLTPKEELKSTFHYIYPKGELGGRISKVMVEGIFNSKIIDEANTYRRLASFNIPVYRSSLNGELHNKLFLIDEEKTIFGSHNFSQAAENGNDELTVIITSAKLTKFLKDELYNKTKLFAVKNIPDEENLSSNATLVISEVMSESSFKMNFNKKIADVGDYIEIYNYGDRPVNLLGYRYDDHYFPDQNNEKLDISTLSGFQGTLVRFVPNIALNSLGVLDYTPEKNILAPGRTALIVGKYFHESFYKNKFIENFKIKHGHEPIESDFPLLFAAGEYYSSVLGDSASGLSSKDRLTLYGIDGKTVIDRFNSPRAPSKNGMSIERSLDTDSLMSHFKSKSYSLINNNFTLKNGTSLIDSVYLPNYKFSVSEDWIETKDLNGTPGIVNLSKRSISSTGQLYSIEAEVVDVESNSFKSALVVIQDKKILDITNIGNTKYPAPIIRDVLLYPGLVDTHNHIKYNTMPIWKVNKIYENRNQWPEEVVYKNAIKEMYKNIYMEWPACTNSNELEQNKCLAKNRCKILKYAEMKALIGGTTSIQGSSSFDENSSDITFKGLTGYSIGSGNKISKSKARITEDLLDECSSDLANNIEREKWHGNDEIRTTAQSIFADAFARANINDPIKSKQTPTFKLNEEFKNKITNTFFVHLGEGRDAISKSEFSELEFLKLNVPQTTVIHGTAFEVGELKSMGEKGISLAWSPTSNLLLYKQTTNIPLALGNKVNVAIGSDWSLSGTKSLLDEIKVAAKVNQKFWKNSITDGDLLKMITINAARASHLEDLIGSIAKNKQADFFIVQKNKKGLNPLQTLLAINESDIRAVFVKGSPIVGNNDVLKVFSSSTDLVEVRDTSCKFNLSFAMPASEYNGIINELSSKTDSAYKLLNTKLQMALGSDFQKLDPLCGSGDLRYISILNSL